MKSDGLVIMMLAIGACICAFALGASEGHDLAAAHCEKFGAFYTDDDAYDCDKRP